MCDNTIQRACDCIWFVHTASTRTVSAYIPRVTSLFHTMFLHVSIGSLKGVYGVVDIDMIQTWALHGRFTSIHLPWPLSLYPEASLSTVYIGNMSYCSWVKINNLQCLPGFKSSSSTQMHLDHCLPWSTELICLPSVWGIAFQCFSAQKRPSTFTQLHLATVVTVVVSVIVLVMVVMV